jgi:protein-disulfide isomerase
MATILQAVLLGGVILAAPVIRIGAEEAPIVPTEKAPEKAKVEQFLKKIVESQGTGRLMVDQWKPSLIPGLQELHFYMDAAGQRRPGIVYVLGDKLILGQIIDVMTEKNLTADGLGQPTKLTYGLEEFDLKGRVPRGGDAAALTLVEFSDFQCPYCKQLHGTLQTLMAKYPGKVRLYYKHFPLPIHQLAYPMALAVECAKDQKPDAFWLLHDQFFTDQYTGSDVTALTTRLRAWAGGAGLDGDRLVTCVEAREPANRIDADLLEGQKLGVTGTPAVIANGEFLTGAQPLAVFERLLTPVPSMPSPPPQALPAPPSPPAPPAR